MFYVFNEADETMTWRIRDGAVVEQSGYLTASIELHWPLEERAPVDPSSETSSWS